LINSEPADLDAEDEEEDDEEDEDDAGTVFGSATGRLISS
jgi:hypothetical protein